MSIRIDRVADDVPDHKRVWYRNRTTGELAFLVKVGDKPMLQLDRANQQVLKKVTDEWVEEHSRYDLLPMQRAAIAMEADKALCKLLGLMPLTKRDWSQMRPAERQAWLEVGPESVGDPVRDRVRHALWKSTMGVLSRLR